MIWLSLRNLFMSIAEESVDMVHMSNLFLGSTRGASEVDDPQTGPGPNYTTPPLPVSNVSKYILTSRCLMKGFPNGRRD